MRGAGVHGVARQFETSPGDGSQSSVNWPSLRRAFFFRFRVCQRERYPSVRASMKTDAALFDPASIGAPRRVTDVSPAPLVSRARAVAILMDRLPLPIASELLWHAVNSKVPSVH